MLRMRKKKEKRPGTNSATPSSIYLFTILLISVRSFSVTSVFLDLVRLDIILIMSDPPYILRYMIEKINYNSYNLDC